MMHARSVEHAREFDDWFGHEEVKETLPVLANPCLPAFGDSSYRRMTSLLTRSELFTDDTEAPSDLSPQSETD